MIEHAAKENRTPAQETGLTNEEVKVAYKVRKLLRPGRDVILRLDSKGKTKIYKLTQESA